MFKKIIRDGEEAREKFLAGVNKVGAYVASTMGPHGRNWIIQEKYKAPQIHNDGIEVARHIFLEDETEDLAAQTLVDIAMNTNDVVGDGTSTAIVIADALITRGYKDASLSEEISPVSISNEINETRPIVLEKLSKLAKKLKKDDLYKVVSTSLRDWTLGKKIAEMLEEVGVDGRVAVEENWETRRETEFLMVKGMKFLGKSVSPYFSTEKNGKEALWKDALVLITNEKIESQTSLTKIIEEMKVKGKRSLVIINGHSEGTACYSQKLIANLIKARLNSAALAQKGIEMINILPIEAPSLTSEQLKDVAVYLNARFIDKNASRLVSDATLADLGQAKEVVAVSDGVIHLTGGKGNTDKRIEELKEQLKIEKDVMFEAKLKDRIASLSASQGQIKVGAPTEAEQTYTKEKIIDAVNSGKAAMQEGIIQGGGIPLRDIAEELGKEHILYEALRAPYDTIQRNAGKTFKVKPNILDAYKVTRLALENALSASAQLISTGGGITDVRLSMMDKLEEVIQKQFPDPKVDFRDSSNIDQGKPTT